MTSSLRATGAQGPVPWMLSRVAVPSALLAVFGAFALFYCVAPSIYFDLLRGWGEPAFRFPFLDLHAILSALQCKRYGIDVMRINPCDVFGRPNVYSPLWLAPASFLRVDNSWLLPTGIGLDLLFIVSLCRLPRPASRIEMAITALATLSPVTAYALERANNDLVIFLLVVAAAPLAVAPWPRRTGCYAIAIFAGLLKYYPLALLLLTLREKPKRFLGISVASLFVLAGFVLLYRPELVENFEVLRGFRTSYYTDAFDFRNLPYGLVALIPHLGSLTERFGFGPAVVTYMFLAILLLDLAGRVRHIAQDRDFGRGLADLSPVRTFFLLSGMIVITGCFFAGNSILYRGIFFLFVLPGLLAMERSASPGAMRPWLRQGIGLIVFLMWSEFFRHAINVLVPVLPAGRITNGIPALFWVIKELCWWRLIALFCGLLVSFFAESASVQAVLQRLLRIRYAPTR